MNGLLQPRDGCRLEGIQDAPDRVAETWRGSCGRWTAEIKGYGQDGTQAGESVLLMGWTEVGPGIFQRRYDPLDVSVCVVRGGDGLLVVDTRSCHREANEILADLRALGNLPVRWVVNTHAHFDHCFGNYRFGPASEVNVPIYGHERVPAHLEQYERPMLADWIEHEVEPIYDLRQVVITRPTHLVGEREVLDLGGRVVELLHLGRGHTDNDLLVHVPDASVWLAGDLVEESGPPMYGSGSFPLDWPRTVGQLLSRLEANDVVVPGHGAAVGRPFVERQQEDLQVVADLIRELHRAEVNPASAVDEGRDRWPFPVEGMSNAIADGYHQLGEHRSG